VPACDPAPGGRPRRDHGPAHRPALGRRDPCGARRTLYAHVARLRALLARSGVHTGALVSHGNGYLINADPDTIDSHRFRGLVEQATNTHDLHRRDQLLRDALSLWRGPALHNAATDRCRQRLCAQLDELHLHAIEESMATGLALGRHRQLAADLARLSSAHPLRGRLVGLYMLALYHTGRTAEALTAYHKMRTTLADELGLDPEPQLSQLHQAILRRTTLPPSALFGDAKDADVAGGFGR
jgi:DNA-binding SARP family transcriptional activator